MSLSDAVPPVPPPNRPVPALAASLPVPVALAPRPRHTGRRPFSQRSGPVILAAFLLLTCGVVVIAAGGAEQTVNPDDPAYLRRQYAWFQAQSPARQQQIRRLHADLMAQEPEVRARLERVLILYHAWLHQLRPEERQRIEAAAGAERMELIRQARERDWVQSLPRVYREEYARLDDEARRQRVAEWRAEQAERDEEWALAMRSWEQFAPGKAPAGILTEGRHHLDLYVSRLKENLSEVERRSLDDAREAADEYGNYLGFFLELVRLSDRHPILPGPVGPKDFASLPEPIRHYLMTHDKNFRIKRIDAAAADEWRDVRRAQGRWPDFALELARYCQRHKLTLPMPLGACTKEEMPPDVVQFLDRVLEPTLKRSDAGRAELEALNKAQGSWPDYPRMIVDLARKHKLAIPGWTLPGPPGLWERLRGERNKMK